MSVGTETTVAVIGAPVVYEAEEKAMSQTVTAIEVRAEQISIASDDDYRQAAEFGRLLQQKVSEVKEYFKPMVDAAFKAHKAIKARENAMLQPLENAKKILSSAMGAYEQEQERRRREAEEAARRAAQEEAERRLMEAAALEVKGDAEGMEAALEEAVIMDDAAMTVSVGGEKPKAAGVSTKKDWEIVSIDSSLVPVTVAGAAIRPVDAKAVMRLIRATKGQVKIPGVTYREKVAVSFRK